MKFYFHIIFRCFFFPGFCNPSLQFYHKKIIFKFVQGFNKCPDDDFKMPFDMLNRGEITDSGKTKIFAIHIL